MFKLIWNFAKSFINPLSAVKGVINPWLLLGVIGVIAGVYFYGMHQGKLQGIATTQVKYERQVTALNNQITRIKQDEADAAAALRAKVADITAKAEANLLKAQELQGKLDDQQENIIVKWKTKVVPGKCSISGDTADMIRSVIKLNGE